MPVFQDKKVQYKPPKELTFQWDTFRRGLNTLLRENELNKEELTQMDNLMLIGKGIPTKRWGTSLYYQAGNATGSMRGLKGMYYSNGTIELLSVTDDGYLTVKSNASYTQIDGASYASGSNVYMAQLADKMYIVNGQRELTRYSGPTLVGFPTIAAPTITGVSNLSNATGPTVKSYRITSVSDVGETVGSTAVELKNQPQNFGGTSGGVARVFITPPSTASGVLKSMNIYGRDIGFERYIGTVPSNATIFDDTGALTPLEIAFTPLTDSTGGPNAKYIVRFQDRLVFAGLSGEPTKILISGREPNQEKYDWANGGSILEIEKDSGDFITGIAAFADRIIVFKERSIWQVTLSGIQSGNYFFWIPTAKLITSSYGCIAPRSITPVENDIFFMGRRGVYTLGYEAGFNFDILRTNEISVKVRPFFENLTISQKKDASGVYFDNKYILSVPGLNKSIVFDRERLAWMGPWSFDARVFDVFTDDDDNENLIYGDDVTTNVYKMSSTFIDDNGTSIETALGTRQEDFKDWTLFKNIRNTFFQFKNIQDEIDVDIRLETRTGSIVSGKNFSITAATGNTGWGADQWGAAQWGSSNGEAGGVDTLQAIRWRELNKSARTMQIYITTTNRLANYELLGIRGSSRQIGSGFRPSSWKT